MPEEKEDKKVPILLAVATGLTGLAGLLAIFGLIALAARKEPPEGPLTHFWVEGLSWPEHFTKYGEDYGRIIRWRAIALLDEADYDPEAGWAGQLPDTGSQLVDVSQPLHFTMPEGWQGAKRDEPNSTIIRLFFETDQGWTGFLDDSPWLLNIPDGSTITFEVTSSGASNWGVA